jgi:hypothetical protein
MLETLLGAIEHVGSVSFWPEEKPPAELARNRAVIERIVLAAIAGEGEQPDVPGLDTVKA